MVTVLGTVHGTPNRNYERKTVRHPKEAEARLGLEVSVGWLSPSSRGLWGGDALLLSTGAAGTETLRYHR